MSSVQPCIKTFVKFVRDNPNISCNCPIEYIRKHPEYSCECLICRFEFCDSDCEECRPKVIENHGESVVNAIDAKAEGQRHRFDFVEITEEGESHLTSIENVSNQTFFSMEISESQPILKKSIFSKAFLWFLSFMKNCGTSWQFWCLLFVVATTIGIAFNYLKDDTIVENFETTTQSVTTTTTIRYEISTIESITKDFPGPV